MRKVLTIILFCINSIVSAQLMFPGVVASSKQSGSLIPRDGLIAYYKCDESSGNLVDSYGSYTGIATGLTYSISGGAINTAETYNGTTSNVAIGTEIRPTTGLSVSFWIKANTQSAEKFLLCNTGWNTNWYGWRIGLTAGGSMAVVMCNGIDAQILGVVDGADALDDNILHHIVLTWNGTTVYTYHDNNKSVGNAWAYTLAYTVTCNLHFGSNEEASGSFYTGLLDEICIYNRALIDSEVTLLFNKNPF